MKRILAITLLLMFCLTGCNIFSGNQGAAPQGTYTDDQGMVQFVFEEDTLTLKNSGGAFATGTFVMSGTQVQITFEGEYADYLNSLGQLTYNEAEDTLTDAAGAMLHKK